MTRPRMIDVDETIEAPIEKPIQKLEGNFYEITDLPSRFLLYPEGTKIFGRPMKVSEIKKLTTMNEINYNSIIKSVLENCIKGIDIDDIPEELSVVPTFIEALDMLEMDAIERDLGF